MTDTGERPFPRDKKALVTPARRRRLIIVAAAVLGIFLLPVAFYSGFEFIANRVTVEHNLPRTSRNSVKHALTAALLYDILRTLSVGKDNAENAILALGFFNETLETYVKIGRPDSLGEQRKDLYNNWAGIVAAEWNLTRTEGTSLPSVIAHLAETGTLMLEPDKTPGSPHAESREWFEAHRVGISQQVVGILDNIPHP